MANTLRFKRGLASGIPTALAGEPLFTTDTFDLYIGNGTGNTRFQKYIASGTTSQLLRGDGSLLTMPIVLTSPANGEVLKYNGTSWVNDSDAGITGSLTTNYLPKATGATTLGNSLIWDNGTTIGINTTSVNSNEKLRIDGGRLVVLGGTDVYQLKLSYNSATSGFWMGSPSANALSFYNDAGTERMRIDASGNLGIGTTSPSTFGKLVLQDGNISMVTNFQPYNLGWWTTASGNSQNTSIEFRNNGVTTATGQILFYTRPNAGSLTERMRITETGNVGIGNTSPTERLVVRSIGNSYANSAALSIENNTGANKTYLTNANGVFYLTNSTSADHIALYSTGNLVLSGTSDSGERLQVTGTMKVTGAVTLGSTISATQYTAQSDTAYYRVRRAAGTDVGYITDSTTWGTTGTDFSIGASSANLRFFTNNSVTERMRLDASGNLGLGVTPSAWGTFRAMEIGGAALSLLGGSSSVIFGSLGVNWYFDGTNRIYKNTAAATYYNQSNGQHAWFNAPSGTAGNAITFTQAMTLDASGRLGIGTPTPLNPLHIYGTTGNQGLIIQSADANDCILTFGDVSDVSRGEIRYINPSDEMVFKTNNLVEAMRITALQNLHIGTFSSDSGERLQVTGTAKITGYTAVGSNLGGANQRVANFKNSGGNGYIEIQGSGTAAAQILSTANGDFYVATGGTAGTYGTTRLFIDNTGAATFYNNLIVDTNTLFVDATNNRVGIGTASPAELLHMQSAQPVIRYTKTGILNWFAGNVSGNNYTIYTDANATAGFNINSVGNVGIGTASPSFPLDVISSGYSTIARFYAGDGVTNPRFTIEGNSSGINLFANYSSGSASNLMFGTGGAEMMRLTAAGRLLIGTTTDSGYKLRVNGTSYYDDNARFPNTKGILFENSSASAVGSIKMATGVTNPLEITNGTNTITLVAIGTSISSNLLVGAFNIGTSATNTLVLGTGTAPSSSPTDAVQIYSADVVAGNAAPHFRTENGAVIKLYQETTSVGNSIFSQGGGNSVLDDSTFDGYTLRQIVKALRNQGILA